MAKLGLHEDWTRLFMRCVSLVTYAVRINGHPWGQIVPTRGLRQGDPLSPYIFLICAEGLSTLLHQAIQNKALRGVAASTKGLKISHLFFADDSFILGRATTRETVEIQKVLQVYELSSGQQLNKNKTSLFFNHNTNNGTKETIKAMFGAQVIRSHESNLGLPSLIGKEVLIKVIAQVVPSYTMSCFKLPNSLCEELTGMGWRLQTNSSSLFYRVDKAKYFPRCDFIKANIGYQPSYAWRSLMAAQDLVKRGLRWQVGDGEQIQVWKDKWLQNPSTYKVVTSESFGPEDVDEILSIPLSANKARDRLAKEVWESSKLALPFEIRPSWDFIDVGIWKNRNEVKRGGKGRTGRVITKSSLLLLEEFQIANEGPQATRVSTYEVVKWLPPSSGCYKVNVNGVVFSKRKQVGIGVVIHDSLGEVVAALSKNMALSLGALETEAKALEEGI
ncbi:uncharacterized protein LOC126702296 [Quercus robur]|uniref:uncharacterized protein LOC126702296 n=1 Tax=Quercus robur TaxID=38942 RepID=UPI002161B06C|nr:uncharacterized protein LOC126702296 [Quercus robur]